MDKYFMTSPETKRLQELQIYTKSAVSIKTILNHFFLVLGFFTIIAVFFTVAMVPFIVMGQYQQAELSIPVSLLFLGIITTIIIPIVTYQLVMGAISSNLLSEMSSKYHKELAFLCEKNGDIALFRDEIKQYRELTYGDLRFMRNMDRVNEEQKYLSQFNDVNKKD